MRKGVVVLIVAMLSAAVPRAQDGSADSARRRNLDQVLDLYVRDGLVYYRALKSDRRLLDAYIAALGDASIASSSREEQLVFWLNSYNALVLRTIVDHYPIPLRTKDYPARSIRQIPGAFEVLKHQVAGKSVTLDQIEQTILPTFGDPRVFLALGRGALGSGRLRSEAFEPDSLEQQLSGAAAECVSRAQCMMIDRTASKLLVSSVFSWRSNEFSATYADKAGPVFGTRSAIERAVLALIEPRLTILERQFLAENQFKVEFSRFDWSLNDLTGR